MGLFSMGPSREEIWQRVASSLRGEYVPGSFLRSDRVQVRTDNGIITLDLFNDSSGDSNTTYTRLRAPFVNRLQQRLKVYRAGFFSELGKLMGTQDIELGEPGFDADFMIQGSSPEWVKAVLDEAARGLIQGHERFFLEVRPDQRLFGPAYPAGVELLIFQVPEIVKDPERLRSLFQLLDHVLRRIETVAQSALDAGERQLAILSGPGGQVAEHDYVLWNGNPSRCKAAAELGRLKERRGLHELIRALKDPDAALRSAAVVALGQIGAPEAVPALVPILGVAPRLSGGSASDLAAQSITMLGEGPLVRAFRAACEGRLDDTDTVERYRASFIQALIAALECSEPAMMSGVATTLARLGAVEAREALRERYRRLDRNHTFSREALDRAIGQLENSSRLPRPAGSVGGDVAALPRPAALRSEGDTQRLPLPATVKSSDPDR